MRPLIFATLCLVTLSCSKSEDPKAVTKPTAVTVAKPDGVSAASAKADRWLPEPGDSYQVIGHVAGIKGAVIRYDSLLIRGGDILAIEGAQWLHQQGVKTVVSVTPNTQIESYCRAVGITAISIPFEYQQMSKEQAIQFCTVIDTITTPLYIHCHSGKQRGGNLGVLWRVYRDSWKLETAMNEYAALGGKPDEDRHMLAMLSEAVKQ